MRWRRGAGPLRACAVLLLAALATVAGPTAGPAAASPLPIGQCTTSSGVVLAVDFSHWGGPLLRSCGTTPTTGYTLLNQGGWQTTGTGHDGPAFICRIGYSGYQGGRQYPTPAQDPCVLTPPASAYWSYWHADPGQNTWTYSQLGAMSYHPVPGSVDLWIFGGTNIAGTEGRPTFSPDTVRARNASPVGATRTAAPPPAPRTTAPPTVPATSDRATRPQPGSGSAAAGGPSTSPSPSPSPAKTPPDTSPSAPPPSSSSAPPPAPTGAAAPSDAAPTVVDGPPVAAVRPSSGSFVPGLVAAVLVAGIGGTAGVVAWRRRRAD
ncbi:hypothetical protein [Peterkaempfera bronchialis]|uniref:Uncharacterized protein n=1 Tax=Peterkaempfera bronchialis TaxID=2126346 RepID=A0A345T4F4_9ACTN|nr:hypothetical protein [Peterkaempfera bronchialis]AXI80859.1 hypothetical protein C7M71_029265 [Peterkaempfera bronchialis]